MSTDPASRSPFLTDQPESKQSRSVLIPIIAGALLIGVAALLAFLYLRPEEEKGEIDMLDLASPFVDSSGNDQMIRLQIKPVRKGDNDTTVVFGTNTAPPLDPPTGVTQITGTVRSLDVDNEASDITLVAAGDKSFTGTINFPSNGMWEIQLYLDETRRPDPALAFDVLVPDPNVNGFGAVPGADTDPEAEKLFNKAMDVLLNVHSIAFSNRLASGEGAVVEADSVVSDGLDGNPAVSDLKSGQIELLTIGDTTWQRPPDGTWIERTYISVFPPSEWGDLYPGATEFQFGIKDEIDGIPVQIVRFYTPPSDRLVAAWYTWWIDPDTGHVLQEVMISQLHYMRYQYSGFDEPVVFEPPILPATPAASPSPVT